MRIGFVGIGRMGEPMVLRLIRSGFQVTVWNRTREKLTSVVAAGANAAADLRELAVGSDVILTMVTDDRAVNEVYCGPNGLLSGNVQRKTFADMSTVLPDTVKTIDRAVRAAEASFVDAPVAGTVQPARDGRLLIFAGGNEADIIKLKPAFDALSRRVDHLGPVGSGAAMKLVHNALLTACWAGLAEATAMGARYGLQFKRMLEIIVETPASFAALPVKIPLLLGEGGEIGFNITNVQKDLRTILAFAEQLGSPTSVMHAVQDVFTDAANRGLADSDVSFVCRPAKT